MTAKSNPFSRFRLVFRRSRTLTKCVVLATVVLCMAALLALRGAILDTRNETEVLRAQAAELEWENSKLNQYIAELGTVQGITRIAQEELGLANPNVIVLKPEQ